MNKNPILRVRDKKGNEIPIPAIHGKDGKSAYEQAKEGGFNGTEQEFIAILNGVINTETGEAAHLIDFNNPHRVTAEQIGAIKEKYYASADLDTELRSEGGKMIVCCYNESTQHTPYTEGKTACTHGMVITNAFDSSYSTQICLPSGEDNIYVRCLSSLITTNWARIAKNDTLSTGGAVGNGAEANNGGAVGNGAYTRSGGAVGSASYAYNGGAVGNGAETYSGGAVGYRAITNTGFAGGYLAQTMNAEETAIDAIQLGTGTNPNEKTLQVYDYQLMGANGLIPSERLPFASGSYQGTNTCGINKPNTLTFDFVPKFVIVSQRGERNATGGGCFIWISSGSTLNFINNGSNYWVHPTLTDKTLSWYCAESASYQLNSSNYTYDYFAWG